MAKRSALVFGVVGYLVAIWYYTVAFAPLTWNFGRELLWFGCLSCLNITALPSARLRIALFELGPLNALIYAAIGFGVGKVAQKLRRVST